jgi:hypothetical protein
MGVKLAFLATLEAREGKGAELGVSPAGSGAGGGGAGVPDLAGAVAGQAGEQRRG